MDEIFFYPRLFFRLSSVINFSSLKKRCSLFYSFLSNASHHISLYEIFEVNCWKWFWQIWKRPWHENRCRRRTIWPAWHQLLSCAFDKKFQCGRVQLPRTSSHIRDFNVNNEPFTEFIAIRAMVYHNHIFLLWHPYTFYCSSRVKVTETLRNVFQYCCNPETLNSWKTLVWREANFHRRRNPSAINQINQAEQGGQATRESSSGK